MEICGCLDFLNRGNLVGGMKSKKFLKWDCHQSKNQFRVYDMNDINKKTYLAGPIMGCTDEQCKSWREYVKTKLPSTLDPMDRDYRGKENESVKEIVEGDKEDINESKFVLVNFPAPSAGTCMEIIYAWEQGKIVVIVTPKDAKVSPWVKYHSHLIVHSFDEAIDFIIRYE